jgi:hypothetical protein
MAINLQIQNLSSTNCLMEIQADEQQFIIGGDGESDLGYIDPSTGNPIDKYAAYYLEVQQYNPLFNALANTGNFGIAQDFDSELRGKYSVESTYDPFALP